MLSFILPTSNRLSVSNQLETMTSENGALKEKLEEVQLELDIIKGEIQLNGTAQVANGIQKRIEDERTMKLEQALIK